MLVVVLINTSEVECSVENDLRTLEERRTLEFNSGIEDAFKSCH